MGTPWRDADGTWKDRLQWGIGKDSYWINAGRWVWEEEEEEGHVETSGDCDMA